MFRILALPLVLVNAVGFASDYVTLNRALPSRGSGCAPVKGAIGQIVNADSSDLPSDQVFVRWESGVVNCEGPNRFTAVARTDLKPAKLPEKTAEERPPTRITIHIPPTARSAKCDKSSVRSVAQVANVNFAKLTGQKSAQHLEQWLQCYPTKHQSDYDKSYRAMIELAADHFKVDASMMKCLLRQEGAWNRNALSCSCAVGLGQQVKMNADWVQKQIGDSRSRIAKGEKGETEIQRQWDSYMAAQRKQNPRSLSGCTGNFHVRGENKERPITVADDPSLARCRNFKPCARYATDDRRCGPASIASTGVYLSVIKKRLANAANADASTFKPFEIQEASISALAAYMVGNGAAERAIEGLNDPMAWPPAIFRATPAHLKNDMWQHMRALRVCLKDGEWGAPNMGGKDLCPGQPVQMAASQ